MDALCCYSWSFMLLHSRVRTLWSPRRLRQNPRILVHILSLFHLHCAHRYLQTLYRNQFMEFHIRVSLKLSNSPSAITVMSLYLYYFCVIIGSSKNVAFLFQPEVNELYFSILWMFKVSFIPLSSTSPGSY